MTEAAKETAFGIMERWGFPVLVALAAGWILRNDVLLPLVEEHRETQREISQAVAEQTKLLYAMQQKAAKVEN
jgi:hypothetical protein